MQILTLARNILYPKSIRISIAKAEKIIARHKAHPWFIYALKYRKDRPHVWKPSIWVAKTIKKEAYILETGCGCAWNLIWFGQSGYQNLYGMDLDPKAIAAGGDLLKICKIKCKLWVDDSLSPAHMPEINYDLVLALNWTYHVSEFRLDNFLQAYSKYLKANGILIIDCVDSRFNEVPNNQYLTSDWRKPKDMRAPTEYKHRFSTSQFIKIAKENNLFIKKIFKSTEAGPVPRNVYVCQKMN